MIEKKEKLNRIERSVLESVLKECPKLIKITLKVYIEGIDVSLFGKYCNHLKALELNCNYLKDVSLLKFAKKFGHKLKEIKSIMTANDEKRGATQQFCIYGL